MLKNLLCALGLVVLAAVPAAAQVLDEAYYQPYNFPDAYESDKLNRHFTLAVTVAPIGDGYYSLLGYGDIGKLKLTEYLHATYGLGFAGGLRHDRTIIYTLGQAKAYDLEQDIFAKAMAGGGLTLRLLNPVNFSLRAGFMGGYENYSIAYVRPYSSDAKSDTYEYKQMSEYYFPISYFTNASVFVPLKKVRLSLSYVNLHLLRGQTNMVYTGLVFPLSN
ncbi:hypothetical protein LJY25_03720 [Hymenobacter sp. BT175]|uniref:hypothetical protein n=1 Tax=Hymenobacter translucens TaxID=2886507 RepID=UPI001D0E8540|nr:hypothetical protein [Hymenobacter translucens]MCC2545540.1 hypothetical protein [Hymenobacter translucens]